MNKKLSICNILKRNELINNFEIEDFIKEIKKSWKKYINNKYKLWKKIYDNFLINDKSNDEFNNLSEIKTEYINFNIFFTNILKLNENKIEISNEERFIKIFELQKNIITHLLYRILNLLNFISTQINFFMIQKNINSSIQNAFSINNNILNAKKVNKNINLYNSIIKYVEKLYLDYIIYKKNLINKFTNKQNKKILKYLIKSENSENSKKISKIINKLPSVIQNVIMKVGIRNKVKYIDSNTIY